MADSDVTYLFFQRDADAADDNGPAASPTIQTTRIIRRGPGAARTGSVPPTSLRSGSMPPVRAASVMRSGSVAPFGGSSAGGGGGGGFSTSAVHRPSPVIRGIRSDGTAGLLTSAPPRRRASISVAPSAARVQRPATVVVGTSRTANAHIFRADDFGSLGSASRSFDEPRPPVVRPPATSSAGFPAPSRAAAYRRASVSGPSSWAGVNRPYQPLATTTRAYTSSTVTPSFTVVQDDGKKYQVPDGRKYGVRDHEDNTVRIRTKSSFESERESLANLRARANAARDQLSRHRVLLDRYLPLNLTSTPDVKYEIEYKVGELYPRMPYLDPTKPRERSSGDEVNINGPFLLVAPYRPAKAMPKVELPVVSFPLRPVFTPKISDVRKRARSVLCKVKGDPRYFDF